MFTWGMNSCSRVIICDYLLTNSCIVFMWCVSEISEDLGVWRIWLQFEKRCTVLTKTHVSDFSYTSWKSLFSWKKACKYATRKIKSKWLVLAHWEMFAGALWQLAGRFMASSGSILRPREGSSWSLMRMHKHLGLLLSTCFNPPQQSGVGILAVPLT